MAKMPSADAKVLSAQIAYQKEVEGLVQDWQRLADSLREIRTIIGALAAVTDAPQERPARIADSKQ